MSWFFAKPKPKYNCNWVRDEKIEEINSQEDCQDNKLFKQSTSYVTLEVNNYIQLITKVVDMRTICPDIYDQGQDGSSTTNAIAANIEIEEMKQGNKNIFIPSRNFIYYNERFIEVNTDSGTREAREAREARISDSVKIINQYGICEENLWPYNTSNFSVKPPEDCYASAKLRAGIFKVNKLSQNLEQLKQSLINGNPIIFGMVVFESFEEIGQDGIMKMPQPNEKICGGHCQLICGFFEDKKVFIVRNSWGDKWGDKGYSYISYDFITNREYCSDFQSISSVFTA